MNAPNLEFIQLELLLSSAHFVGEGFEAVVVKALEAIGGTLLFNVRVDHDTRFQRCAAVVVGDEADRTIALVFLNRDGRSATVRRAEPNDRFGRAALEAGKLTAAQRRGSSLDP